MTGLVNVSKSARDENGALLSPVLGSTNFEQGGTIATIKQQNKQDEPPSCNTGVHSPKSRGGHSPDGVLACEDDAIRAVVSLDWIAFTIPAAVFKQAKSLDDLILNWCALPVSEYTDIEGGRLGWKRCTILDGMGGAFVATVGQNGTAYIQLSAEAIRYYAVMGWDVWGWMVYMHTLGAACRRLDIAFDDRGGYIEYQDIVGAFEAQNVVSRYANKFDPDRSGSHSGGRGWTFYFGSYGGETFVRIYDKAAEQHLEAGTHWVRVEAVFRGERGEKAFAHWKDADFSASSAVGLLRGLVDFRENQGDNKPERWPLLAWWSGFLGSMKAVHLGTSVKAKAVIDYYRFLEREAAAALAVVNDWYGEDVVSVLVACGRNRRQDRHMNAMRLSAKIGDRALPGPVDTIIDVLSQTSVVGVK